MSAQDIFDQAPIGSASVPGTPISIAPNSDPTRVEFGRSMDGLPVARIGDLVFAMVPGRDDDHFLANAWRLQKPFERMTREDFYSHHGNVADEAAFRARIAEQAEHGSELKALDRKTVRINCTTPWGASQGATIYAEGVVSHHTASHGGFLLSPDRNAGIHPVLRNVDCAYEEDCGWAAVAIAYPDLFTRYERRIAERTIKDYWPDVWEAITGTILPPGESHEKDRHAFERDHAGDWVVISALSSSQHPGMVEVIATRGGKRDHAIAERRFLVPSTEYGFGRFGFVIDEARHAAYDGPSSFVGWQGRSAS